MFNRKSLRLRLEAYYSLIAPDQIANAKEWRSKFEQIYQKYGGSYQGERKLASKLAKKYGTAIRLLVSKDDNDDDGDKDQQGERSQKPQQQRSEDWYDINHSTGDLRFLSAQFDPQAALRSAQADTVTANPPGWLDKCPLLDNVQQFVFHLPKEDPQHRERIHNQKKRAGAAGLEEESSAKRLKKNLHPFDHIAHSFEGESTGNPLSLLHKCHHQRIRVVIRYVNAIRGTLTGKLIAFDKHMNMILRDVEEIYSPRPTERHYPNKTNTEIETERRQRMKKENVTNITTSEENDYSTVYNQNWTVRTRKMKQLLVRGDEVVSINRVPDKEEIKKVKMKKHIK